MNQRLPANTQQQAHQLSPEALQLLHPILTPERDENASATSQLQSQVRGYYNSGNSCFASTVVQALLAQPRMRHYAEQLASLAFDQPDDQAFDRLATVHAAFRRLARLLAIKESRPGVESQKITIDAHVSEQIASLDVSQPASAPKAAASAPASAVAASSDASKEQTQAPSASKTKRRRKKKNHEAIDAAAPESIQTQRESADASTAQNEVEETLHLIAEQFSAFALQEAKQDIAIEAQIRSQSPSAETESKSAHRDQDRLHENFAESIDDVDGFVEAVPKHKKRQAKKAAIEQEQQQQRRNAKQESKHTQKQKPSSKADQHKQFSKPQPVPQSATTLPGKQLGQVVSSQSDQIESQPTTSPSIATASQNQQANTISPAKSQPQPQPIRSPNNNKWNTTATATGAAASPSNSSSLALPFNPVLHQFQQSHFGRQEDCAEFLQFCIERLQSEADAMLQSYDAIFGEESHNSPIKQDDEDWTEIGSRAKKIVTAQLPTHSVTRDSAIQRLFAIRIRSCLVVASRSTTQLSIEPAVVLPLSLCAPSENQFDQPRFHTTIEDCLAAYMSSNTVEGYKGKQSSNSAFVRAKQERKLDRQHLPQCLILHLARFEANHHTIANSSGPRVTKLQHHVEFESQLTIQDSALSASSTQSTSSRAVRYQLNSVIVHHGPSVAKGHYTTFIRCRNNPQASKHPQSDSSSASRASGTDCWMHCDDSKVTSVSQDFVQQQQAYVLTYKLLQ